MNIPPTPETIARVNEWGEMLCSLFSQAPFDVKHSDDAEVIGFEHTHMFQLDHDTLPGRSLIILWGIPKHSEDCGCITPPNPRLTITVRDGDTKMRVEESGEVELENPVIREAFVGVTMMATTAFHTFGNI